MVYIFMKNEQFFTPIGGRRKEGLHRFGWYLISKHLITIIFKSEYYTLSVDVFRHKLTFVPFVRIGKFFGEKNTSL